MGTCDTWNVEVNILVYEDEVFICLVTKFAYFLILLDTFCINKYLINMTYQINNGS